MSAPADRAALLQAAMGILAQERRQLRASFTGEGGLLRFIAHFWHVLEPDRDFVQGWALEALCKHLQAVSDGKITRLLITVPPGSMKSLLCSVFWPAWEWSAFEKPNTSYINFSYASHLTERDNEKFLAILSSAEFRKLYPEIELRAKGVGKVSNSRRGWKFATSVGGVGTGERGNRVIADDLHNIADGESAKVRGGTTTWFKEAMSNRLNDMSKSAIIVIMQRVHEDDVAGIIIAEKMGYVHLCIPLEYEPDRHCTTYLPRLDIAGKSHTSGVGPGWKPFWTDPRKVEGECFWPERFGPSDLAYIRLAGPFAFSSQYQQRPSPRGGGIFQRSYWRYWQIDPKKPAFPATNFRIASLDGAFTDKTQNDPSGFSVWGTLTDNDGNLAAISMAAWRKHLTLNGTARHKERDETWHEYKLETEAEWGLVQWVAYECARWKIHKLLIENKANGPDVNNELIRQFRELKSVVQLVNPGRNDKTARAHRVQPMFSQGLIYTLENRRWAEMLVDDMAKFPNGKYDDVVDSATMAINFLRANGMLEMAEIRQIYSERAQEHKSRHKPLYSV